MSSRYLIGIPVALAIVAIALVVALSSGEGPPPKLANTLLVATGACAISLPVGTMLAGLLMRTDLPARRPLTILFVSLLFVPLFLHAAAWDSGFGRLGWLTFSRGDPSAPLLTGWLAAIWIHSVHALPWVVLLVGAAMMRVEPKVEQQALLDLSPSRVFWAVTLTRSLPAVALAGLWVFLTVATDMTVTDLYAIESIPRSLYNGLALGDTVTQSWQRAFPLMAVFGVVLTLILLAAVRGNPVVATSVAGRHQFRLGKLRKPALLFVVLVVGVLVLVPLLSLFFKGGQTVVTVDQQLVRTWSLEAFISRFWRTQSKFAEEHMWTFVIATATSVVTLGLAFPLAWWLRRRGWSVIVPVFVIGLLLAIPAPLLGLTLASWFNSVSADWFVNLVTRSIFSPVVAMSLRALPLCVLLLWHAQRTVAQQSLESAALDGAGPVRRWWSVAAPQIRGSLVVVVLVTYLIAAGDLAASILVVPPGISTFSIRTFGMLHAGVTDEVACVCIAHLLGYLALGAIIGVQWGRSR